MLLGNSEAENTHRVAVLDEELIKRGTGFYPTSRAVQLAKLLIEKDRHVRHESHP
jgi:hypothetical protein